MGGTGSGRRASHSGRSKAEDSMPLDIRKLNRAGALTPGRSVGWSWTVGGHETGSIRIRVDTGGLTLSFLYGRRQELVTQWVMIQHTDYPFGGARPWFTCPSCSRRVALLFGRGRLFACRHCQRLAYASQSEEADDRALRRADRLRRRLGWQPGVAHGIGDKPKGMHWRTFDRLVSEYDALVHESLAGMARKFGLTRG